MDVARSAPQGAHYLADVIYLRIKKGAMAFWYSELSLHQLGFRPTVFIPRWTTHPCILYQMCATRGAGCFWWWVNAKGLLRASARFLSRWKGKTFNLLHAGCIDYMWQGQPYTLHQRWDVHASDFCDCKIGTSAKYQIEKDFAITTLIHKAILTLYFNLFEPCGCNQSFTNNLSHFTL